jgi:hypothetical protein
MSARSHEEAMTAKADAISWTPFYAPRIFYRDLVLPVDHHHTDALRQRDLEIFTNNHGAFCRRAIPREFADEVMAGIGFDAYVVVSFSGDMWHRRLAAQRVTLTKSRRRVKQ